ncbi:MAG: hypothetical protein KDA61_20485, partial [Planctomycetales bacterium]|nr:hypothetical protein [Planctomycetales bacterium]
ASDEEASDGAASDDAASNDEAPEQEAAAPETDDAEAGGPALMAPPAEETQPSEASSDETTAGATADPLAEPVGEDLPDDEEEALESPAEPADLPDDEEDEASSTSRTGRPSPFRLVSFQADVEETEESAEQADAEAGGTDAEPADSDEANVEAPSDAASSEEPEYLPLDDVRDEIRSNLARDKAVQALSSRIDEVYADLRGRYDRYRGSSLDAELSEGQAPEPPAELKELAGVDGEEFSVESTPSLTFRELAYDTIVGRAIEQEGTRQPIVRSAFMTMELYQPVLAKDLDGNWYIVIKTSDEPQSTPKLEDVKDDVVKAWKRREAAKLAKDRAEELAKQFAASSEPFGVFFSDRGVKTEEQTQMFSWLTYGLAGPGTGRPPMLASAPPLENVGPEFMETAFSLSEGDVKATANHDRSAAYVVRLNQRAASLDKLKEQFLEEFAYWPGKIDTTARQRDAYQSALVKQLEDKVGLKYDEEFLARRNAEAEE